MPLGLTKSPTKIQIHPSERSKCKSFIQKALCQAVHRMAPSRISGIQNEPAERNFSLTHQLCIFRREAGGVRHGSAGNDGYIYSPRSSLCIIKASGSYTPERQSASVSATLHFRPILALLLPLPLLHSFIRFPFFRSFRACMCSLYYSLASSLSLESSRITLCAARGGKAPILYAIAYRAVIKS